MRDSAAVSRLLKNGGQSCVPALREMFHHACLPSISSIPGPPQIVQAGLAGPADTGNAICFALRMM